MCRWMTVCMIADDATLSATEQLMFYILRRCGPMSKKRLVMLMYLCDLEHMRYERKTFTGLKWVYDPDIYASGELDVIVGLEGDDREPLD